MRRRGPVVGDFLDHGAVDYGEVGAAGIFYGDVEGAEEEFGAAQVDGVAGQRVDNFHDGGLDGLLALDERDGMKARVGRRADAADHALVEIAELLSAESGGAATDSGDLDVSTGFVAGLNGHISTFIFWISFG